MRFIIYSLCVFFLLNLQSHAKNPINVATHPAEPIVALTLDACGGTTDHRILEYLSAQRIPATIFVTKKWLDRNPEAIAFLKAHSDIFNIQNHGRDHKEAIFYPKGTYGLPTVKDAAGLQKEVEEGSLAIQQIFGVRPQWYRSAGALYDQTALKWLKEHHWSVAGYTIAADEGATASKARILYWMQKVQPSDVILMHLNKPRGHTYEGLVAGIPILQAKGFKFGWLGVGK